MDSGIVAQQLAVTLHEIGGGQSLGSLLHLRIGEGDPQSVHLVGGKEVRQQFDVRAQKRHIGQSLCSSLLGALPHTCAFDIHAYVISIGIYARQAYGIISVPATKFEQQWMVVMEKTVAPLAFHRQRGIVRRHIRPTRIARIGQYIPCTALEDTLHLSHLGKFLQFVLTHVVLVERPFTLFTDRLYSCVCQRSGLSAQRSVFLSSSPTSAMPVITESRIPCTIAKLYVPAFANTTSRHIVT